jgi:hypothetical protein
VEVGFMLFVGHNEGMKQKAWTQEDKEHFATNRLRASTIPDKKKKASKEACRKQKGWDT